MGDVHTEHFAAGAGQRRLITLTCRDIGGAKGVELGR
jgi:hypothetical protein